MYIGHVAVFYVPSAKLDDIRFGETNRTPRTLVHQFILSQYNAYTHQKSDIQGYWRETKDGLIFHDQNEMFEVSFQGVDRIPKFVDFLAALCYLLDEQCIYLRMGIKSWLVFPKPISTKATWQLLSES
jgi:hypothetical protein